MFYFNNKKNGVFVEFGANDGITNSNTYYLEKELEWNGICIEPIPHSFKNLENNRNCIKLNVGISDKECIENFTVISTYKYQLSGITEEYNEIRYNNIINQAKNLNKSIENMKIPCVTLNSILEKHNIFHIDYLSIDTEGNEFKIIKTIDFKRYDIELLSVENLDYNKAQTDYIISMGYKLWGKLGRDEIFSKIKND